MQPIAIGIDDEFNAYFGSIEIYYIHDQIIEKKLVMLRMSSFSTMKMINLVDAVF